MVVEGKDRRSQRVDIDNLSVYVRIGDLTWEMAYEVLIMPLGRDKPERFSRQQTCMTNHAFILIWALNLALGL